MKRLVSLFLGWLLNLCYRLFARGGRRNLIGFISRQASGRTTDFRRLGDACEQLDGWDVEYQLHMLDGGLGSKLSYAVHMISETRLLARCRLCFVEGYNPALSMLHLESAELGGGTPNTSVPVEPVVLQIWHAGGAFKKFGYQTIGTPQGRSEEDARLFRMHANYSWIVCSGESARPIFAAAFGYPEDRVVALGRPSNDELLDPEASRAAIARVKAACPQAAAGSKPVILLAPTLRRGDEPRPFDELRARLEGSTLAEECTLLWSDHPVLEPGRPATTADLLHVADLVVTDYSSVVYDAALLEVPFAFYVPDIERYRVSPGLNVDPVLASPGICFEDPEGLIGFVEEAFLGAESYPISDARAFIGDSLSASGLGATRRVLDFALDKVESRGGDAG